ncbi:hypothetical protein ARALYDRAFT_899671 [Arabidopsis lyrata subsp. lyrata]|uniref:Uncharacterized protein n=1 Tax=Arabidopsis lyrata subsp. lyrata TaxID=81972 RepID=D7L2M6_ARALL|nr:hypothetical protein ARALYDRAFT_899671 [Arabidopsis lyrata subsp. lyrata]
MLAEESHGAFDYGRCLPKNFWNNLHSFYSIPSTCTCAWSIDASCVSVSWLTLYGSTVPVYKAHGLAQATMSDCVSETFSAIRTGRGLLSGGQRQGVLSLCGVHDAEAKLVFLCASNDNSLHLYDLPSLDSVFSVRFTEKGKVLAEQEIRLIQIGPRGIFFTGDGSGLG